MSSGTDASGLLYRRNRYYDPLSGQFTQQDPIGIAGGLNLYGFADGDPVNYSDPFGLCPPCIGFLVGAWAVVEIGSAAYDAYNAVRTVFSDDASTREKFVTVGLAAASIPLPGGGYTTIGKRLADDIAKSAAALDKGGLNKAGRAWTKHAQGQRPGSRSFPSLYGDDATKNRVAMRFVKGILNDPGSEIVSVAGGFKIYAPSGRGIHYTSDGRFITFVERE